MTAGDLRLEMTLAPSAYGVVGVTASSNCTLFDVEMMLECMDLASDASRMVSQSNSGGYMISFDSFAKYASALEAKASNKNVLIPARYSSLKTLFTIVRDSNNLVNYAKTIIKRQAQFVWRDRSMVL